ncbi:hypothetical protein [Desulfomonile tiedjei]|uniref:Uncharacterized protein n=1 Tax=Desulfomonile tiedjei (strain ATCC 49306 / DSM 6799 / DCB-1) TaxID=706587 RepID=I4C608_DESTA|nr:hypothetical protein [Desulfomonile tiedjei]AFM24999.1 hypothetical protein Desti_2312 [Desulfomonile tiedjei DSM 6799]
MDAKSMKELRKKLADEGWIRRFTAEEPRLSEMKELYESLGFEVRVEAALPEESQDCRSCFDAGEFSGKYKTIFTRGESFHDNKDDDLYE